MVLGQFLVFYFFIIYVGAWRSLVAHWSGGPGVEGSNPFAPTIFLLCFFAIIVVLC